MIQTVEAVVDSQGRVLLLGPVCVSGTQRALVTVFDETRMNRDDSARRSAIS